MQYMAGTHDWPLPGGLVVVNVYVNVLLKPTESVTSITTECSPSEKSKKFTTSGEGGPVSGETH